MKFVLPDLPYAYEALEPIISAEIMQLHYQKHHAAYVNNLNAALETSEAAIKKADLNTLIATQGAIRFNGGGHINHSLFWKNLTPEKEGGGEPPRGPLAEIITSQYGTITKLIEEFNAKAAPIQGSGWCWLCRRRGEKRLEITACPNQDPLFATTSLVPLLGIDVWEHAYYLQYKNARPEYLKNIWKVVNWQEVAYRYEASL